MAKNLKNAVTPKGPHVWVGNFALESEWEADRDDPSSRQSDLEDFAAPQVVAVSTSRDDCIEACKRKAEAEFTASWVDDGRVGFHWTDTDSGAMCSARVADPKLGLGLCEDVIRVVVRPQALS